MDAMAERCARAICPDAWNPGPANLSPGERKAREVACEALRQRARAKVRAVLLLLREPSGEMARAMGKKYTELEDHDFGKTPPRVYPQDMPAIFTAAIDAALSEMGE